MTNPTLRLAGLFADAALLGSLTGCGSDAATDPSKPSPTAKGST